MKYLESSRNTQPCIEECRSASSLFINLPEVCSRIDGVYQGKTVLIWMSILLYRKLLDTNDVIFVCIN